MSTNCYVSQLKAVVNNDNLNILGAFYLGKLSNVNNYRLYITELTATEAGKSRLKILNGSGTITYGGTTYNLEDEGFPLPTSTFANPISAYLTSDENKSAYLYITNKEYIKNIDINSTASLKTSQTIYGCSNLEKLNFIGSANDFTDPIINSFKNATLKQLKIYNSGTVSYAGDLSQIETDRLEHFEIRMNSHSSLAALIVNVNALTMPTLKYIRLQNIKYGGSIINLSSILIETISVVGDGALNVERNYENFASKQVEMGRNSGVCTITYNSTTKVLKFGSSMDNPTEQESAQGWQIAS